MEEQPTWKGHTFTLLIFSGIVVLCSIFFVLGMLVGRTQGQKLATVAAADAAAKNAQKVPSRDERPEMSFYDSGEKKSPVLEPAPAPAPTRVQPEPVAPAPKVEEPPAAPPPSGNVVNFQIGALKTAAAAEQLIATAKKQGFHAFMLTPVSADPNPLYRVQVGPVRDAIEEASVKQKLIGAGYHPMTLKP
jgi:cell division septation protein DedD